ncbi:MAG TPA: Asp-tRNA(Asn)/Glu-tRNA(Gln) amidotransferase subunit GatC [Gemmatimonadaceae bacterium]
MAVTLDDVRHVATLARLGVDDARAAALVEELNTILRHMEVLSSVDTAGVEPVAGVGAVGLPLRPDGGHPIPLAHPIQDFAPKARDGFFLVPRLSTHEDPEASS